MSYMERIKQFRKGRKITQQNIADKLGITQQQWFKYEKEVNELPIRYLEIICKEYGVSADWILGLTNIQDSTTITITAEAMSHELKHYISKKQADDTEGYYKVD